MNDEGAICGAIICLGFAFGMLFGVWLGGASEREAIAKCELNMPRTQNCVLTAIPAQGEKP